MANHYDVLGVGRTASPAEIRKAYVRLARERHPDRFSDPEEHRQAEEFFKGLTAAFNTLSNDQKRRDYDASLDKPRSNTPEEMAGEAFARGKAAFEARDTEAAVEQLRAAAHLMPGEARYHALLAEALGRNPKWAREAISAAEQAIQLEPGVSGHHSRLARLLVAQGLKLRARKAVEAGLAVAPSDAELTQLAQALRPEDEPDPGSGSGGLGSLFRRRS